MKLIIETDENNLNKYIFDEFVYRLEKMWDKEYINIWLSWWNSILSFYKYLQENGNLIDKKIWEKINLGFVDERIVPFEDKESNYWLLKSILLDKLVEKKLIKDSQIKKIYLNSKNISKDYTKSFPFIDIWLFWVGEDWHIASIFPKHQILKDKSNSYLQINDSPKLPKNRITISPLYLQSIDTCFVFFIWEKKVKAFENFLDPGISETICPAKLVYNCENQIIISNI